MGPVPVPPASLFSASLAVVNLLLMLCSCAAVWLLLELPWPHLMSLPLAQGSRHTCTGAPPSESRGG